MRTRRGLRPNRLRVAAALLAALALVAACGGSTASSAPPVAQSPTETPSTQPVSTQPVSTPSSVPSSTRGTATGRWEQAGTMAIDHQNAVLLGDGRVLVVGSRAFDDFSDASTTAELWDPATGAWRTTESLPTPRADFATVPLKDGRVLIAGGRNQNDQSFSSAYIYDPRPGNEFWSKVGLMGAARTSPITAVLADGRVLVAGGYFSTKPSFGAGPGAVLAAYRPGSYPATGSFRPRLADVEPPNVGSALATAELFDPGTVTWSATGPMNFARFGAGAVTLADGRILVVGSAGGGGGVSRVDARAFDTSEIYDPKTGRFSLAGRLPAINRSALQKQGVPHANLIPEQDPVVDGGTLAALKDGGAVLIAQAGSWKHQGDITRSFRFDAGTGAWTEIGRTFIAVSNPIDPALLVIPGVPSLAGAMVARLPDGQVLVAGGAGETVPPYSDTYTSASAQLYDPASDTWSPLPPMPEARAGGVVVILKDGSVLLAGGSGFRPPGDQITLTSAIRFVPSP